MVYKSIDHGKLPSIWEMSQLPLVPDPQLLGRGTKYRHIQQVTGNQGFYQIKKFVYQNTPEKRHIHLGKFGVRCTLK